MIRVLSVAPDSIGDDLGLTPGTELLAVNGRELSDFLDWEFLTADDQFEVEVRLPNGDAVVFDIERPEGYPMGLEIEPPRIRRCGNRCDFCFVDGLPTGLRQNLYVRDDDYRLSFRHGNFATLTNLKESDVRRILEYRLSPLYVSVHATDPVTRRRLLRNPRAPAIVEQLQMFAAGGLQFHTQIVLQPGLNDGPVLVQSLNDLYAMGDPILSVSVVPVGLTEFSKHTLVRESSREESRQAVETVTTLQVRSLDERGVRWVFGSDELYIRAQLPLPEYATYGDFEQVENGVGSVRFLQGIIDDAAPTLPHLGGQQIAVVTGAAMRQLMPLITSRLEEHTRGSFDIIVVENDLFGPRVTTAGLLPGKSMLRALEHRHDVDIVLLPAESLNDDRRFIDDMPLETLVAAVPADVRCSYDFADVLRSEAS